MYEFVDTFMHFDDSCIKDSNVCTIWPPMHGLVMYTYIEDILVTGNKKDDASPQKD